MPFNPQSKITVQIVTWNSMSFLPNLFKSLDEQTLAPKIVVVDNASNDNVQNWINTQYPQTTVLRNMSNNGFARAHNQAIKLNLNHWKGENLDSKYVVICNPDIEFAKDALQQIVNFMDSNPDVAACSPKLYRAYRKVSDIDSEHFEVERSKIIDSTGLMVSKAGQGYDRGAGEIDNGQYDNSTEVFGISGACSVFRASKIQELSINNEFYDEDIFAYKEDLDLSYRLQWLGMKVVFIPQAIVWHHRAIGSKNKQNIIYRFFKRLQRPKHIRFLSTRNHCWVLIKNISCWQVVIFSPWFISYEFLKLLSALFDFTSLKGYFSAMKKFPLFLKKRHQLFKQHKIKSLDLVRKLYGLSKSKNT